MSAGKRDQIDKKFFFQITNVLDQIIKFTSILLKNFFLKKISIWSLFPALTPYINVFLLQTRYFQKQINFCLMPILSLIIIVILKKRFLILSVVLVIAKFNAYSKSHKLLGIPQFSMSEFFSIKYYFFNSNIENCGVPSDL